MSNVPHHNNIYNPDEECLKLVKAIRNISIEKNLSQKELARQAELSASTMNSLIHGKTFPVVHSIFKICNALNMTVLDLLAYAKIVREDEIELSPDEMEIITAYRVFTDGKKKQARILMEMLKLYHIEEQPDGELDKQFVKTDGNPST